MRLLGAETQQKYVFEILGGKKIQKYNYNPSQTIRRRNGRIDIFFRPANS